MWSVKKEGGIDIARGGQMFTQKRQTPLILMVIEGKNVPSQFFLFAVVGAHSALIDLIIYNNNLFHL